jgi:X-Pro dipeptidyl-peptidase
MRPILIVLACLLAPLAGAEAGPRPRIVVRHGVTQPVFSYEDAIRETVYVQSTIDGDLDGDLDLLATDIIRPAETERGLKVPVIYEMSPYYQSQGRGNESETKLEEDGDFIPERFPLFYDNYFVPRGYAVVLQDMRGTRNSEGCMVLGGREELIDAQATIDWLNGRGQAFTADGREVEADWSTGKVGMIGKSYDGTIANGAASTGVKGLTTIVPIAAISRWYDYHLNNGVQYLNAYATPALFTFVIDQELADDEERGLEWIEATFSENGPCSAVGLSVVAQAADPRADYNAFWDDRDYLKDAKRVRASVFVVHGLNDYNVKPNHFGQWWKALARRGVARKIWLSQTGHVDPFDFRRKAWVETLHRWFDYWLQGIDNGIMDEPRASIERFPGRWVDEPDWPAPGARPVRLRLAEGVLVIGRPTEGTVSFTDDPRRGGQDLVADPGAQDPNRVVFLSPKLKTPLRISGIPKVSLRAGVDRVDTNLSAFIVDYPPAGEQIRRADYDGAGEGVANTERESCWGQSSDADDACYLETERTITEVPYEIVTRAWFDARHHGSLRTSSPLVPGQLYRFEWELFADDYVFEQGHRIGLVIAGADADFTVPDFTHATVTVELGGSHLVLPVVGGKDALEEAF